jgi:hypothetical protein
MGGSPAVKDMLIIRLIFHDLPSARRIDAESVDIAVYSP